jgi:hypothetical protein
MLLGLETYWLGWRLPSNRFLWVWQDAVDSGSGRRNLVLGLETGRSTDSKNADDGALKVSLLV